jgi:hypothetical protein
MPPDAIPAEPQLAVEDEKTATVPEDWLEDAETLREPTPHVASPPPPEPVSDSFSPPLDSEPTAAPGFSVDAPRLKVSERDQLPQFVSDRLVTLDQSDRRQQLLWWSAGGIGIVALIALAMTIWIWAF